MGITYALVFQQFSGPGKVSTDDLTFNEIKKLFFQHEQYGKSELTLYCDDDDRCLLSDGVSILDDAISLGKEYRGYLLDEQESLRLQDFPRIKIGTEEMKPSLIVTAHASGLFEPTIFNEGDDWYYLHPTQKALHRFDNTEALIAYVKKKPYLPNQAGYAK